MSVDKLRESHHINRVQASDLGLLLSAQSYRPEITTAIRNIKCFNWLPLQDLIDNKIGPGPHPAYGGTYPCLKTKNVDGLIADRAPADWADVNGVANLVTYQVQRGDLLINLTGAGSIGRVSVYYGDDLPITNQHIARMKAKPGCDEGYLAAFLRSWWGERVLEQGVAGSTGQINIVNEHVRSIPVVTPNEAAQRYIGDKVRQAERLQTWAFAVQSEAAAQMPNYRQKISPHSDNSFRVSASKLTASRLDPSFNHPNHRELDAMLQANGCVTLAQITDSVTTSWRSSDNKVFQYFEIGGLNVANGTISPSLVKTSEAPSRATTVVRQGDILVATVRPNRRNVAFLIADDAVLPMVATSGFVVLRFTSLEDAAFYHAWLRTEDATSQLMRWNSGSAYPAIDEDVPLSILVPKFDKTFCSEWGKKLLEAQFAFATIDRLTWAAKLLVEALIEGKVAEADLSAAQQTLGADDNLLDRAILARVKTDGVDGQGPPLFPDLDQLYELLAWA